MISPDHNYPETAPRAREPKQPLPLAGLLSSLTSDASHLFRQEISLAKTEISNKASEAAKHLVLILGGVFFLCNGVILAMAGLSYGVSQLFLLMGLNRTLSNSLGFLLFGGLVVATGVAIILYAKNKLTGGSLLPERSATQLKETKSWAESKIK